MQCVFKSSGVAFTEVTTIGSDSVCVDAMVTKLSNGELDWAHKHFFGWVLRLRTTVFEPLSDNFMVSFELPRSCLDVA